MTPKKEAKIIAERQLTVNQCKILRGTIQHGKCWIHVGTAAVERYHFCQRLGDNDSHIDDFENGAVWFCKVSVPLTASKSSDSPVK